MIETNGPLPGMEWLKFPDKIKVVADRLMGVQIECQPALQLTVRYNRPDVLIYSDPPYVLETRTTSSYRYEMNDNDHIELLEALDKHVGPVLLSGYSHPIYNDRLKHWNMETKAAKAENGASRTEVLWINPVAASKLGQQVMF